MITKKDLLSAIDDMPLDAKLELEVLDSNAEPYSAFIEQVWVDKCTNTITLTDEPK